MLQAASCEAIDASDTNAIHQAVVAGARNLVPTLRERAARCEEERRVSDETMQELAQAGIFKMLRPKRWGGYELDYGTIQLDIARELGRGCGSTAWVAIVVACHDWIVGMYPKEAQEEVWGQTPDVLVASAFFAEMSETRIEAVDGGYSLRGRWRFSSGCDHCDWMILGGMVKRGDGPPENLWFIVPGSECRIDDTWFSPGLAGTGSKDILVENAFVPEYRAISPARLRDGGPSPGSAVNPSHIYRLPLSAAFPFNIGAPAIGIARGMLEAYAETAGGQVARSAGARMGDFQSVQLRASEAAVEVDCADLLIQRDAADINATARRGDPFTLEQRFRYRRDLAYATMLCRRAAERLTVTLGAQGLVKDSPVQRAFRDLYAVTSQIALQWDVNAPGYAQVMFGFEPTDKRV